MQQTKIITVHIIYYRSINSRAIASFPAAKLGWRGLDLQVFALAYDGYFRFYLVAISFFFSST